MTNVVLGVLLSVPSIWVPPPWLAVAVRTGKFCRLLAPASGSSGSFGVGPMGTRSIPNRLLVWMEFRLILFPVPLITRMPSTLLKAILLPAPTVLPPITLLEPVTLIRASSSRPGYWQH